MSDEGLRAAEEKMRAEGVADVAISTFATYYRRLESGERGILPDADLAPVGDVPSIDDLPDDPEGARDALGRAVMIKLNGGLGTSMGMSGPKSLLEVKEGHTFLEIVVRQAAALRRKHDARLPLVLMNSFSTREPTLDALGRLDGAVDQDVPFDFLQNKEPKLEAESLAPVSWPQDPALEWSPPGHGDIYTALAASGMLEQLLEHGYRYAFVSNVDNLGAVLDERILAWFAREKVPFLMEVAERTEADRKGGHVARRRGDGLVLREIAQTRDDDLDAFQDVSRHRFFNANTIWLNLRTVAKVVEERKGVLGLPMIVNRKTVDPTDKSSPQVVQLEAAMGAAIDVFEGAAAIKVPRRRFAPVKTTNDLLMLRSDAYVLTEEARVELAPEREDRPPFVDLDADYYKLVRDFDERFPSGPPSLIECERLVVKGDVQFGADVRVKGSVTVEGPKRIEDGATLEG
jgi:UTP--glucose-1-phosphate uridylyltransferase